jgi:exodeoxyribonuclease VII large subunit
MAESDLRASNAPEITVSELSNALKRAIEDRFGYVRVRGEISGYRGPHSSGHAYFSLKDANARLDAVIWRSAFLRMRVKPEEGVEVVATGKLTTFPGKSSYQIVIESLELAGLGALMALFEARRRKLGEEGLFDVRSGSSSGRCVCRGKHRPRKSQPRSRASMRLHWGARFRGRMC